QRPPPSTLFPYTTLFRSLDFEWRETPLHETLEALAATRRAPVYLVNFSQRAAAERAQDLMSAKLVGPEEKDALKAATAQHKADTDRKSTRLNSSHVKSSY